MSVDRREQRTPASTEATAEAHSPNQPNVSVDRKEQRTERRIMVVGGGGREHALAWSLGKSSRVQRVLVAPGNAGTVDRLPLDVTDPDAVVALAQRERIDLVVIGPETALAAGGADALRVAGIDVFGPTRNGSQLEWSKSYCRQFSSALGLASPASRSFHGATAAIEWADAQSFPVVVKADGLAAGKGVVVPATIIERNEAITRLCATGPVVLEELLHGEEISVLAFCDGATVVAMPVTQDHKRIGEGDTGPNTGGMGAYCPTPVCPPELAQQIVSSFLQPTVDRLAAHGIAYCGVLYAGVILTAHGPKLLEFNCRFGDPETQTLLPLLRTDLLDVVEACIAGSLNEVDVQWHPGASCTVVMAADGYPDAPHLGDPISGLDGSVDPQCVMFQAGTSLDDRGVVASAGGRVLSITGLGDDLSAARHIAYGALAGIGLRGSQIRRDIGWRALARTTGGYAASGVSIDEGNRAVALLKGAVEATHTPAVLSGVGAFGGAFDASALKRFEHPVLVGSTDGVGTKVMVAAETGRYRGVGHDIVNHCVNDVLVQRAEPLFFLDYVASSALVPEHVAEIVAGMAEACTANGCVLLGGETAEMPGVYRDGHFDIAGTLVGVAERDRLLPRHDIQPGDALLALASSGPHTNGYSLLRNVLRGLPLDSMPAPLQVPLADALLAPHRSYLNVLRELLATDLVKALVHVTGGGLQENVPRVLPTGCGAEIVVGSWPVPPLFQLIRDASGLPAEELHRALNMGIGMIVVVAASDVEKVSALIDEPTWNIGTVTAGDGSVVLT